MDIWKMDLEKLKMVYADTSNKLSAALLEGTEWSALADERELLIRIGVAIEQREQGHSSPASSGE